jgi:hypothetical protein
MIIYHFVMRSRDREIADLGFAPLRDDAAALAFGEGVARELAQKGRYVRWSMDVTDGERAIGTIRLALGARILPAASIRTPPGSARRVR